jgi:ribosomal-protein-alanine N-acetyltransferase
MTSLDVRAAFAILQQSPAASAWPESSLRESALSGTAWIAEQDRQVLGFLIGRSVADEFEILNLAVAPSHRRLGVATRLLGAVAEWLRRSGARRAYLEVRESNASAMELYVQNGFKPCGRRVRYYQYPIEDAIVLSWNTDGPQ